MHLTKKTIHRPGFTLIELVIAMAISTIVMAAIYSAYVTNSRINTAQESVVEMQQNIRAALGPLTRDIRMAGYDPSGSANTGFVDSVNFSNGGGLTEPIVTSTTQIAFTADLDDDGSIDLAAQDSNNDGNTDMTDMEQVAYRLGLPPNDTNLERYSTTTPLDPDDPEWQTVAEQIERIEFNYVIDDTTTPPTTTLTPTVAQLQDITSVQITLLAIANRPDPKFTNTMPYTTASGAIWPAANDNFRRRLLLTTVKCRNMGL